MGWSIGLDERWQRDIGYGVPAVCDHPGCDEQIDRGLAHVCGGEPYGGEEGCGLYFCSRHLYLYVRGRGHQVCAACRDHKEPFDPKPDVREWIEWKLIDPSWAQWRDENADDVERLKRAVEGRVSS